MTYVELDERVTALEENGGGGINQNGKTRNMCQISHHLKLKQVYELKYITVTIVFSYFVLD